MPSPQKGRHRAPRQPLFKGAVAVPAVLLAASGGAFGGLAGLPALTGTAAVHAAAAETPTTTLAVQSVASSVTTPARRDRTAEQERAVQRDRAAQAAAYQRARTAAADRATRSRRAALEARSAARASAVRLAAARKAKAAAAAKAALPKVVRPAQGPVTSRFGPRWGRMHAGMDFGSAHGSPVRAASAGEVVKSGFDAGGYGNFVHVQHGDGTVTTYNHLSRVVRRDGAVAAGDVVGLIGNTGHSTGPHLHFEVRIKGAAIDPVRWLRSRGIAV